MMFCSQPAAFAENVISVRFLELLPYSSPLQTEITITGNDILDNGIIISNKISDNAWCSTEQVLLSSSPL